MHTLSTRVPHSCARFYIRVPSYYSFEVSRIFSMFIPRTKNNMKHTTKQIVYIYTCARASPRRRIPTYTHAYHHFWLETHTASGDIITQRGHSRGGGGDYGLWCYGALTAVGVAASRDANPHFTFAWPSLWGSQQAASNGWWWWWWWWWVGGGALTRGSPCSIPLTV